MRELFKEVSDFIITLQRCERLTEWHLYFQRVHVLNVFRLTGSTAAEIG